MSLNNAARRFILANRRRLHHQQRGQHFQFKTTFSTLTSSAWSDHSQLKRKRTEEKEHPYLQNSQQKREYLPLIVAVVAGGAWFAYRKIQHKPVAPDEALVAQEAYRKQQERLQQQQKDKQQEQQRRP